MNHQSKISQQDVSIIIVNWNAHNHLVRCLESLPAGCAGMKAEIWVVDNASSDGSAKTIRSKFPDVYLIENGVNLGFSTAINQAAMKSKSRYLLLLNPDTEACPGSIRSVVTFADANPDIGILGPKLLNDDLTHQRSCWRIFPGFAMAFIDAFYLWKFPGNPIALIAEYAPHQLAKPIDVRHLLGACMLIRREAWLDVGPLDEGYFLFLEETDWCYRAKRAGWRIVYYPDASIIHRGQQSTRQQPARSLPYLYRSYCRFYRKRHPGTRYRLLALKAILALSSLLRISLWSARRLRANGKEARTLSSAMVRGYQNALRELAVS